METTSAARRSEAFPFGSWEALRGSFLRAAGHSAFVARQLERSGLSAEEAVASPEAWLRLAPVTKADMIEDQRAATPYGTRRCVPLAELGLVVESSGSTGKGQEVHYLSRDDVARTGAAWAAYLAAMGVTAQDTVALCLPIGMAGGGVRHLLAYSALGATVLRVGGLSSERKIEAMQRYGATTLVATPAYVDRLGVVAEERGLRPGDLSVERIVVATQSVGIDWIRSTEELWGARLYEWYGTSAGVAAFACAHGMAGEDGERGTLHWNPEIAAQEVVDPASGRHVEHGERGEVIATPLINEAEPLFRISTGDEVRFRAPGSCACGSSWPGMESGTVRRLDATFKVKGVNLSPAVVDAALLGREGVLDYRVRIWQDGEKRERLSLHLRCASGHGPEVASAVRAKLLEDTGLSFDVDTLDERASWRQQTAGEAGKARRWVDERGAAG